MNYITNIEKDAKRVTPSLMSTLEYPILKNNKVGEGM